MKLRGFVCCRSCFPSALFSLSHFWANLFGINGITFPAIETVVGNYFQAMAGKREGGGRKRNEHQTGRRDGVTFPFSLPLPHHRRRVVPSVYIKQLLDTGRNNLDGSRVALWVITRRYGHFCRDTRGLPDIGSDGSTRSIDTQRWSLFGRGLLIKRC